MSISQELLISHIQNALDKIGICNATCLQLGGNNLPSGSTFTIVAEPTQEKIDVILFTAFPRDKGQMNLLLQKAVDFALPIIICVENIACRKYALELLAGQEYPQLLLNEEMLFTPKILSQTMQEVGYAQESACDIYFECNDYMQDENVLLANGSLSFEVLKWLGNTVNADADVLCFVRTYLPSAPQAQQVLNDRPFLSVITCTQGNRIHELRETLLCLEAQAFHDFEVVLLGHKVKEEYKVQLSQLIEDLPESLRTRLRYISLETGGRSALLNFGFAQARGLYVTILDDNNLVMGNWTQIFWDIYKNAPGSILHAYCVSQNWHNIGEGETGGLAASQKTIPDFCSQFDYPLQLHMNVCPTMSLAFPAAVYQKMGISFDETLDANEDWDFLMRAASVCGVKDSENVTSICRLWENTTDSVSLPSIDELDFNRQRLLMKRDAEPFLMPHGSSSKIEQLIAPSVSSGALAAPARRDQVLAVLYGNNGQGFTEELSQRVGNQEGLPNIFFTYENLEQYGFSESMRFDPAEQTNIVVYELSVDLWDVNGQLYHVPTSKIKSNGYLRRGQYIFLKPDPQIYFGRPKGFALSKVVIRGKVSSELSSQTIDAVVGGGLIKKIIRKVRRLLHM